jgi:hypothetical protein
MQLDLLLLKVDFRLSLYVVIDLAAGRLLGAGARTSPLPRFLSQLYDTYEN